MVVTTRNVFGCFVVEDCQSEGRTQFAELESEQGNEAPAEVLPEFLKPAIVGAVLADRFDHFEHDARVFASQITGRLPIRPIKLLFLFFNPFLFVFLMAPSCSACPN